MSNRFAATLLVAATGAAQTVYKDSVFDVVNSTDVTYAQGLTCNQKRTSCTPMDLKLEVSQPASTPGGPAVPTKKPAIIIAHGGSNAGGDKSTGGVQGIAAFYAARGFVAFNINYRLKGQYGLLPKQWYPSQQLGAEVFSPNMAKTYPAVRDCKAAVRFVRANAEKYGVDPDRIAVSGGSAGAGDMVAVGITFEDDYKSEISVDDDPTLASTHLSFSSRPQVIVSHWGGAWDADLVQQYDPQNRTRYAKSNPPTIEFHGDKDTTVPIEAAYMMQASYAEVGVPYELHVLEGCGHAAWCYDGKGRCGCGGGSGYGDLQDTIALPFVATHLDLELVEKSGISV